MAVLPQPKAINQNLQEFPLSQIRFEFNPHRSNWTVVRMQFPLRLAYATTFNSSQGLTLDRAVIDLRRGVFAHGQLYTGLTHFQQQDHRRVLFAPGNILGQTNNIVSQELLLTNFNVLQMRLSICFSDVVYQSSYITAYSTV